MVEKKPGLFERVFGSAKLSDVVNPFNPDNQGVESEAPSPQKVTIQYEPQGSSGVANYGGYYSEDYLRTLQGRERADFFDRMYRSDAIIKMLVNAVINPILAAAWHVDAAGDDEKQKIIAEHMSFILMEDMDKSWTAFIREVLSFIKQGYSLFEVVDKAVVGHPKYGNYNGLESLAFRSQRTIERFNLDPKTGKLVSVSQYAYGDLQRTLDINAAYLLSFVIDKEGDNYEGVSWLRPCVGPYKRKDHHLKLESIGIDKYAVPTPILKVPQNKEKSGEKDVAERVIRKFISHEQQFISMPFGWEIDFLKTEFDPARIRSAINSDNEEMVKAFLANFLNLGQGSGGGSYALSFDLSDFFLGSIEHLAQLICEEINRCLIPRLVKLNYGPQESYPQLRCSGISDKAGKEFADSLKALTDSKIIVPDDNLEDDVRQRYNLPDRSDDGQRQVTPPTAAPVPPVTTQPNVQASEVTTQVLKLEDPKKQIKADRDLMKDLMYDNLSVISKAMIEQVMAKYRKLPDGQRLNAIKNINPTGQQDYQAMLLEHLANSATRAIQQARKEVPKKKNVKLVELLGSVKLSEFDALPLDIQKRLKSLASLLIGTQVSDLEKTIFFRYQSSVDSTDSESTLQMDLQEGVDDYLDGKTIEAGAGAITAQVVNDSRNAFFMDDEVSSEIESYTFVNADPVSDICQALEGTVFAKDDPDLQRYWPPLHFNCKSFISPNLVGSKNPDLTDKGDSWSKAVGAAQSSINLSEPQPTSFVVQSILISKNLAKTSSEAQAIAQDYQCDTALVEESETGYKFINKDASLFEEATMKSFDPMSGVCVYLGILKQPDESISEI